MKRFLKLFMLILVSVLSVSVAHAKDEPTVYFIEGAGTGTSGTYLVQVTALSRRAGVSDDELCRYGVHGVLFRGFQNGTYGQQKPLAGSALAEAEHKDFYDKFFDDGIYRTYATMVSGTRRVVKVDKKYRITATVTVQKDALRKDLEQQGIIKALNAGF